MYLAQARLNYSLQSVSCSPEESPDRNGEGYFATAEVPQNALPAASSLQSRLGAGLRLASNLEAFHPLYSSPRVHLLFTSGALSFCLPSGIVHESFRS